VGAILLMVCGGTDRLCAASSETDSEDNWDIRIGAPFWASGLKGTVGVGDREAHVDKDSSDIGDTLDFEVPLNLEMRKQRWLFFANGLYAERSADAQPGGLLGGLINEVEFEQKQVVVDFGLGYNLIPGRALSLELFAGGRVRYVDAEITGASGSFSRSETWADPIFGVVARWQLGKRFTLFTEADIGGFGVSSDLTWQVNAGLEWNILRHLYLRGSYRQLDTEFEDGGFEYNITEGGPQLELGFRF
jgi:hypothetical protein